MEPQRTLDDVFNALHLQRKQLDELDKAVRKRNEAFQKAEEDLGKLLVDYDQKAKDLKKALADTEKSLAEHKGKLDAARGGTGVGWILAGIVVLSMVVLFCQFCRMNDRIEAIQSKLDHLPNASDIKELCGASTCSCPEVLYIAACCAHDEVDNTPPPSDTRKRRSQPRAHRCHGQGSPHRTCTPHQGDRSCISSPCHGHGPCGAHGRHGTEESGDSAYAAPVPPPTH